ncbi:MAG TPA: peptidoglycan editing factor PgeF [Frankiaceae bacterium]|nr:peptidoglycan editing factor PgeF [Frankiaceae bacterium]
MDGIELLDAGSANAGLPAGVTGGFTTRAGGVSVSSWLGLNLALHVDDEVPRVLANRDLLRHRFGTGRVSFPNQVHGAGVSVVDEPRPDRRDTMRGGVEPLGAGGADALVTALPGVPVGVLVADCLPVLLADPVHRVVGAAHAGRRGLAAGVLQATVAAMTGLGADPATTEAVIGPAICGRCYEVPAEMRDEVDAVVAGTATQTRVGTPGLDLPAGAGGVLAALGVAKVINVGICTVEDERFYSYRRDGVTGRFAGVIVLDPDG